MPHWIDKYFKRDFIKILNKIIRLGSWYCMGNTLGEISMVPKENAENAMLTCQPIYWYVSRDKIDSLSKLRKVGFFNLLTFNETTKKYESYQTKFAVYFQL